ncbi:MAG: hypothetical protein RBT16_12755 [Desulfococcus multivorans]|jgi:hypothetical protein|nr:hypothetical protein [Desulfococcus multivorans]
MFAERLILETDHTGKLKDIPKLPPNKRVEAIILVISDIPSSTKKKKRVPHPSIAGKIKIYGDIFDSISVSDWFQEDDRA